VHLGESARFATESRKRRLGGQGNRSDVVRVSRLLDVGGSGLGGLRAGLADVDQRPR
jgi:hypothetical protein